MFTRIKSDVNGNHRYVVHFLHLNTQAEKDDPALAGQRYAIACKRANSIGGRKYNNKSYCRGIVFQSYSLIELAESIKGVTS